MTSTSKNARIARFFYLLLVIAGPLRFMYIPSKLFVHGNASATAANIAAHETLFRLGIVGDLFCGTIVNFVAGRGFGCGGHLRCGSFLGGAAYPGDWRSCGTGRNRRKYLPVAFSANRASRGLGHGFRIGGSGYVNAISVKRDLRCHCQRSMDAWRGGDSAGPRGYFRLAIASPAGAAYRSNGGAARG